MTDVAFHFNVADRLAYACRIARKAQRQGVRLAVVAAPTELAQLDRMLWELEPTDFIAHCRDDAEPAVRQASGVLLTQDARQCGHREAVLNLCHEAPAGFAEFGRVIEIVSQTDESERTWARQRWRLYTSQGHALIRHDAATRGGG
ncbi:DNA polymerase III subunit chi [Melaminivora sp.]